MIADKKRLIELDDLIDNIDWDNDLQKWTLRGEPEDIPTVDAVEVVHGRWEEQKEWDFKARDYFLAGYTCSCCGFWYLNPQKYNYCPNCGAKMDGAGNG